jgi:ABC-type xylose transport system permease subunit
MTAVLIILVLLAIAFGVGAVIEGLAWMFLIVLALLAVAVLLGRRTLGGRRTT